MTGEEMAAALEWIGWTRSEAARRMQCNESRVRRMIAGEIEIPDHAALWLTTLVAVHRALMAPLPTSSTGACSQAAD